MSDLEHFRSEWLHELKGHVTQRSAANKRHAESEPAESETIEAPDNEYGPLVTCTNFGDLDAHTAKRTEKRRLVKLESNTNSQENPRAFDIADRLLQGEILTNGDLFRKPGELCPPGSSKTAVECAEVPAVKDCSSLLDMFISDLVKRVSSVMWACVYMPRVVQECFTAYSSGEVRLWQRTGSGVQLRTIVLDPAICLNNFNHVTSVGLSKSWAVIAYAEGEVCVADVSEQSPLADVCRQTIVLPGPAKVTAWKQDNHFAAFGGTHIVLVDPLGQPQSVRLSTKVSHVALIPNGHERQQPPVVSAAEDAVRLHAGERFEADGVSMHHLIGATVTCLDASPAVIALGVTDSVRIFDLRTLQCEVRISAHGLGVSQVQMDEYSLVTGGQDGLVCVWDLRTKAKLWEMFCRHPVKHLRANPTTLITAHVPDVLFPEPEDGNIVVHTRYSIFSH
ncbi:hypothetical protein HPB48_004680 [Haemaphysalis longicornis]|uniref:Uncharacterized protein n=1 Tax=Haemaphysalis longicornis TaxID=44386 RepID=A0A9J6G0B6_HAELO|nr:hypothetical protein HPB48_004680 [Haemaphysalis longicornis]